MQDYPTGAALSFMPMALLLIGMFSYARALGTEEVLEYVLGTLIFVFGLLLAAGTADRPPPLSAVA